MRAKGTWYQYGTKERLKPGAARLRAALEAALRARGRPDRQREMALLLAEQQVTPNSQATVSRILRAAQEPRVHWLTRVEAICGLPAGQLISAYALSGRRDPEQEEPEGALRPA